MKDALAVFDKMSKSFRRSYLVVALAGILVATIGLMAYFAHSTGSAIPFGDRHPPEAPPSTRKPHVASELALTQPATPAQSIPHSAERTSTAETGLPVWIWAAELEGEDATRLARLNAALSQGGMSPIDRNRKILPGDLPILRMIVDEAEKSVANAEDAFLDACTEATRRPCKDLLDRLERKEVAGLPLLGPENRFTRNHPHEAITQVLHGGKCYVIRVGPWLDPGLARAGAAHDAASERRRAEYASMVLPLFH